MTNRPIGRFLVAMALLCHPVAMLAQDASVSPDAAGQVGTSSEIATLRGLLAAEKARIGELERELQQRQAALDELASRLDAVAEGAPSTPQPSTTAAGATLPTVVQTARPLTPDTPRFDFYADTLVRLSTLHQGYDGCNGCPDRTIGRIRLRFGAEGRVARGVRAVFGLSAGELNDPNSVYQTFGGNLGRKVATWDRAYLVVHPTRLPWLELQGGKFPYPWLRSSMTFDVDFYPEGASERIATDVKHAGALRSLSLQGFQVVANEQPSAPDMLIVGSQAMASFRLGQLTSRVALTGVDIRRPELILQSQLDGSNVGVKNTNAIIITTGGLARYASGFQYANVIVENTLETPWPRLPVKATVEYNRNTKAASDRDSAASFRLDLGRQQKAGDWEFNWHFFRVEQDAIVSAMGESDWRAPSNVVQHRIGVVYTLQDHVQALFTWYRGRTLDRDAPGALLVPALPAGRTEPYANRLYFDLNYRF